MNLMSIFGAPTSFTGNDWADDRCVESDRAWGGGIEIRIRRTSLCKRFDLERVSGPDNNFGMVRSGINFAL